METTKKKKFITVRGYIESDGKILAVNQYTSEKKDKILVWTLPGGKYKFPFRSNLLLKAVLKAKVKQKTGVKVKVVDIVYESKNTIVFECRPLEDIIYVNRKNPKNSDVISAEYLYESDNRLLGMGKIMKTCRIRNM